MHIAVAEEMGLYYNGTGQSKWVRHVHIVTATTIESLKEEKKKVEDKVLGLPYEESVKSYLRSWQTLEEYTDSNK